MGTCGICFRQAPCGYSQCRDCIESFGVQERPTEFRRWASNSDADALAAELEKCRAELAECESDRKLYRERAPLVEDLEATFDAIRTQRDTYLARLAAVEALERKWSELSTRGASKEPDAPFDNCLRELREALKAPSQPPHE